MAELKLEARVELGVATWINRSEEALDDDLWIDVQINDEPAAQMRLGAALEEYAQLETAFADSSDDILDSSLRLRAIAAKAIELADRLKASVDGEKAA